MRWDGSKTSIVSIVAFTISYEGVEEGVSLRGGVGPKSVSHTLVSVEREGERERPDR